MGLYRVEAVVLRTWRLGESDRIVNLLTPGRGKVRAVVKGVRKTKSRFGSRLEPMVHVSLLLYEGRELDIVTQAETVEVFRAVREDLDRLGKANSLLEAVDQVAQEGHANARLYQMLLGALRTLAAHDAPLLVPAFFLKLLAVEGFHPMLDACAVCGSDVDLVAFAQVEGGVLCGACAGGVGGIRRPLGRGSGVGPPDPGRRPRFGAELATRPGNRGGGPPGDEGPRGPPRTPIEVGRSDPDSLSRPPRRRPRPDFPPFPGECAKRSLYATILHSHLLTVAPCRYISAMEVDRIVAQIAARQLGLFTYDQAVGSGASDGLIKHRVRIGRWIRVGGGVYRVAGVPVTWQQRALAACLVAGPGAVVSHRSAAVVWGVSGFRPGPLEITVPAGRSGRNSLAEVHRSDRLPTRDRTTRQRIPVTRPARTVIDLAGRVGPALLEEAVDDVLCRRLVPLDKLRRRADELGRRRGSRALRTVLEAWTPGALPEGVAEMRIVRRLVAAGLPEPVRQHEIRQDGELVARVDLAYPAERLAIELDSFRWHAGRGPFRSDRLRGNRIEAAGWRVLRATPEDAEHGHDLIRAARALTKVAA